MVRKKKKWYTLTSPKVFGGNEIGETISTEAKKLVGRIINVNAKELTGDFKKSHISIKLIVNEVNDDNAVTQVKGYAVSRPYIQRFIHKGLSNIEIIHNLLTADKHKIKIRCMAVTNNKIQATKKRLVRDAFKKELENMLGGMTLDNIVFIATTNKIQKALNAKIKKLQPLRFVEIKKISVLERSKEQPKEKEVELPPVEVKA